jgi:putative salt-induced outer membrane protein YdiY
LTWAGHLNLYNNLFILMDITNVKRNDKGKRRKRKNEGINRRKDTLMKKAYELGEFDGIDIALIICKYGRYITYRSRDHTSWPPSIAEIVSKSDCLLEIHDRC